MKRFIKNNKLLFLFLLLSLISFVLGIFFYAFLDNNTKDTIVSNINLLVNNKLINYSNLFSNNIIIVIIICLFGISIVGIFFIMPLLLFKIFIFSFECISLFSNLGLKNILVIILYLLPNFIRIVSYFIICYYACCFSFYLIKNLFMNSKYNMHLITKKYLFISFISIVLIVLSCLMEIFINSNLSKFLIK